MKKIKDDFVELYKNAASYYSIPFKWSRKQWQQAIIIIFSFLILFLADEPIRIFFSGIHNKYFDSIFSFAHWYGKPALTITVFAVLYMFGLVVGDEKSRMAGWKIFQAFIISGILVTAIKSLFGRWRPYTEHGSFDFVFLTTGPNAHLSLPSGDAAVAFAFSTIVAGFIDNKLWKVFWFSLATLTLFGRIYHDQHWLTDVTIAAFISVSAGLHINKQAQIKNIHNE